LVNKIVYYYNEGVNSDIINFYITFNHFLC